MKKSVWVAIAAGVAAAVAGAISLAVYLSKKSKALKEHLDYDPDDYFEEECECTDDDEAEECCCDESCECGDDEEVETIPLHPEEEEETADKE